MLLKLFDMYPIVCSFPLLCLWLRMAPIATPKASVSSRYPLLGFRSTRTGSLVIASLTPLKGLSSSSPYTHFLSFWVRLFRGAARVLKPGTNLQ